MADVKVRIIAVDEASGPIGKAGDEVEKTGKKAKGLESRAPGRKNLIDSITPHVGTSTQVRNDFDDGPSFRRRRGAQHVAWHAIGCNCNAVRSCAQPRNDLAPAKVRVARAARTRAASRRVWRRLLPHNPFYTPPSAGCQPELHL